jgi:ornithine cyclodeaminase/alanine dehydrogenase-like protein (mu-crystallin family)
MRAPVEALIITKTDIARAMAPADWVQAAELAFRAAADGKAISSQPMHIPVPLGGFHVKAASISLERDFVAVKVNGNFPTNPDELGLPTVQGAILLSDGSTGELLAIIDSIEVTLRRTAAASALAARLLARPGSSTLLLCGCGAQGRAHVEALREVLPLERLLFWDRASHAAEALAGEFDGVVANDLTSAALSADVIVCCTSARKPFLHPAMVTPGTLIAAVGADNPEKNEIASQLMAAVTVVVDSLQQCAVMGDLHHAIGAGLMAEADAHTELAEVLVGTKPGRRSADEIIIFDSTGTGLLDVTAAATIYAKCAESEAVLAVALASR